MLVERAVADAARCSVAKGLTREGVSRCDGPASLTSRSADHAVRDVYVGDIIGAEVVDSTEVPQLQGTTSPPLKAAKARYSQWNASGN